MAEYPKLASTPCKPGLLEAYEAAKADTSPCDPVLVKRCQVKLGKAMFASSLGVRPDLAYPIGICARTSTIRL